jgi:hypothetical protein
MKKNFIILAFVLLVPMLAKADVGIFDGIINMGAPNVTQTSVDFSAVVNLISGDPAITHKGFVWSTLPNPTTTVNQGSVDKGTTTAGPLTEVLSHSITSGLTPNTVHHVRAYVTNSDGTYYSQDVTFITIPTLGEWGLIAFGGLIVIIGGAVVWRRLA